MIVFNYITLLMLTLPFLLIYIVYSMVYFKKIDKKNVNIVGIKPHGLSRMCFGGIFFMFGIIILNLICQFSMIFLNKMYSDSSINLTTDSVLFDFFIKNISNDTKDFHTNILIDFTIACTALYTGAEGIISSVRTLQLPAGMSIELPLIKRKRMSAIFYVWAFIAIMDTLYNGIVGSKEISFYTTEVYVSLGSTLIILFLAERSSSMFKGSTILSTLATKTVDVSKVSEATVSSNVVETSTISDHNNNTSEIIGK